MRKSKTNADEFNPVVFAAALLIALLGSSWIFTKQLTYHGKAGHAEYHGTTAVVSGIFFDVIAVKMLIFYLKSILRFNGDIALKTTRDKVFILTIVMFGDIILLSSSLLFIKIWAGKIIAVLSLFFLVIMIIKYVLLVNRMIRLSK